VQYSNKNFCVLMRGGSAFQPHFRRLSRLIT
jgi:hypothetical protein